MTVFGFVNYVCPKVSDETKTSIFRTEGLHPRTQRNVPQGRTYIV